MRVLTSSVLIMEAIVLLLAIPVAVVAGGQPAWVGWLFAALALACARAARDVPSPVLRPRRLGPAGRWSIASGFLIGWMMFVLGAVFTALWWTALRLGRKAEAAQAAS